MIVAAEQPFTFADQVCAMFWGDAAKGQHRK
jgi:hypothetical protein